MRKNLIWIFALILLVIPITYAACSPDQCKAISNCVFYDSLINSSKWKNITGNPVVTYTHKYMDWNTALGGVKWANFSKNHVATKGDKGILTIEMSMKDVSGTQRDLSVFGLQNFTVANPSDRSCLYFSDDGGGNNAFYNYAGGWIAQLGTKSNNVWYRIKWVINLTTQKYDFYINDLINKSDINCNYNKNKQATALRIQVNGPGTFSLANISVYNGTSCGAGTPSIGTISKIYPLNNSAYTKLNLTISAIINATYPTTNVSFFINQVKNKTITMTALNQNVSYTHKFINNKWYNLSVQIKKNSTTINSSVNKFFVNISTLIITSQTPANNTQYPTTLINYTISGQNNATQINCSLYLNAVFHSKYTKGGNGFTFNWSNIVTPEGLNHFYIYCVNNYQSYNKTNQFWVDVHPPVNANTFVNNSVYYKRNISAQFNFTDNLAVFSFNVSIDGKSIGNKTGLATIKYQLNISKPLAGYAIGKHTLTERVADGHTAEAIDDYKISTGVFGDVLRFEDDKNYVEIKNKASSLFDKFIPQKQTDRYIWTFKPNTLTTSYTFTVKSNNRIYIMDMPNTIYKKWIITNEKWIDFNLANENTNIDIKQIKDNEVEVTISNIKSPAIQIYHSIGDLNIVTETEYFYRINATEAHQAIRVETQRAYFNLTINKTSSSLTSNAYLLFNGTSHIAGKISSGIYDNYKVNFTIPLISSLSTIKSGAWHFNISNINVTINLTQWQQEMYITNCSNKSYKYPIAIEFNTTEEAGTTKLLTNVSSNFKVWLTSSSLSRSFPFTFKNVKSYYVCIYPNITLNVDYTLGFSSAGYLTRHKTVANSYLNKTKQFIPLYLLSVGAGTSVTINVIDQIYNPLRFYYIHMYLCDIVTNNCSVNVQSEQLDYNGNAILWSYISSNKYRFVISNTTGNNIFDTQGMYITANPMTIRIPTTSSIATGDISAVMAANNLNFVLFNTSSLINFTWKNSSFKEVCLKIDLRNINESSNLYFNCSALTSGTLKYNVTSKGTVFAYAYVKGSLYSLDVLILEFRALITNLYTLLGKEGILYAFIITLLGALAFAWNPSIAGFGAEIGLLVSMWIGFIPFSLPIIMGFTIINAVLLIILRT